MNILRVDSSAQTKTSVSRELTDRLIDGLKKTGEWPEVVIRDLSEPLPQIDSAWIAANTTPEAERTDSQRKALGLSDMLIGEIEVADILVIGVSLYNFSIPASLKLWIDLICRARRTFTYAGNGPEGLMTGKKAVVCFASGGTQYGSEIDFASDYVRHILGFIGIQDVFFVAADRHFIEDTALPRAKAEIDEVVTNIRSKAAV